ncbi:MAG: acyltransferase [Bacteroidales bacterium]|nr:acyltransferase [Bacteroidales bacterium]
METLTDHIFHLSSEADFEATALLVFELQYENNTVYRTYCQHIGKSKGNVRNLSEIPFLPISFFKTHDVKTGDFEPELIFRSSGTTGMERSRHLIKDAALYRKSLIESFRHFYGNPSDYVFLALLPNYIEQKNSSLIYMMEELMRESGAKENGYYLYNHKDMYQKLIQLRDNQQKTILWGVTFALLDFAEQYTINFPQLIVFETGGMKGRRKEMVKEELYDILRKAFGVADIHSEYGMCELLSQAYSKGGNIFSTPPWMQLRLRSEKDPFDGSNQMATGVINIIDLANLHSCAFIATEDLGRRHPNGIEILGRMDHSQTRGCSLMVL